MVHKTTTHLRSLLHVMYVISSLVLVIHPYATHFRSLLPVMYVISSLVLVSATPYGWMTLKLNY
jgi:hypothetical protein